MYLSIIIGILFIAIACSKNVRDEFMQMVNDLKTDEETKELIYALVLICLFLFILTVSKRMKHSYSYSKSKKSKKSKKNMDSDSDSDTDDEEMKENFFFVAPENRALPRNLKTDQEVSFPPREAIYTSDRPINFSFSTVGSGQCEQGGCQAYGIIKGCPGQKTFGSNQFEDTVL